MLKNEIENSEDPILKNIFECKVDSSDFFEKFRQGDDNIFRNIFDDYNKKIFRLVFNMVHNIQDTEDLLQRIFTKIFINRKSFKGKSKFYTWIYRIAVNEVLNFVNKEKKIKNKGFEKDFEDSIEYEEYFQNLPDIKEKSLIYNLEQEELKKQIFSSLNKLDKKYKTILILKEIDNFSYKEIADILGISIDKVKVWIYRARENMKKNLEEEFRRE
jgi:RNA polymerase sigma-70 factor, ECF subfamily